MQRQGHLDAAARPFMLPDLGGIDLGVTKEPALHVESPVSEGTQDSEDDGAREENTDGEGEVRTSRVANPLVDERSSCANPSQLQTPCIDKHSPSGPVQGTRKWGQR